MAGFFSGGGATLTFGDTRDPNSFPQYGGRWRGGQVVEIGDVMPQTNMETGAIIADKNGRPKEQLPVTLLCDGSGPAAERGLRTDERNPNDATDTGRRVIYIKGSLRFAIGDALRTTQADDIEIGGYLFLFWQGMGKSGRSEYIGRTWDVHYIKPSGAFLNSVAHGAPGFQNAAPQGAMPVQQNAQGQYAPQHSGFTPMPQPVTAPPQQTWAPAQSAPVAPPNPYSQQYSPGPQPSYQPGDAQHVVSGAQPPQAPYGPPQGSGAPTAGNPWS